MGLDKLNNYLNILLNREEEQDRCFLEILR
jgi:hypothetical protein